jgi:hypothetical protein
VKLPLGDAGNTVTGAVIVQRKPGRQMVLHGAVGQRALRSSPAIDGTLGRAELQTCFVSTASQHSCPFGAWVAVAGMDVLIGDRGVKRYAHTG